MVWTIQRNQILTVSSAEQMKKCIVWGGTGQAKMIRPILEREGYRIAAVFDDDSTIASPFPDIPFAGGWNEFLRQRQSLGYDMAFAVAIGGDRGRDRCAIGERLKREGLTPLTLIHATAHVGVSAAIGEGSQILPMAAVCEEAQIGSFCIVNTKASVDHESILGSGVHVMPGATVAGAVHIGNFVTIGSNATILPRVSIADGAVIGAGAVVTRDVGENAVIVGVPGREKAARRAEDATRQRTRKEE
jgi:sugar O-acyltransferase (sialic acid O-acetyltransferase NeuD family)